MQTSPSCAWWPNLPAANLYGGGGGSWTEVATSVRQPLQRVAAGKPIIIIRLASCEAAPIALRCGASNADLRREQSDHHSQPAESFAYAACAPAGSCKRGAKQACRRRRLLNRPADAKPELAAAAEPRPGAANLATSWPRGRLCAIGAS